MEARGLLQVGGMLLAIGLAGCASTGQQAGAQAAEGVGGIGQAVAGGVSGAGARAGAAATKAAGAAGAAGEGAAAGAAGALGADAAEASAAGGASLKGAVTAGGAGDAAAAVASAGTAEAASAGAAGAATGAAGAAASAVTGALGDKLPSANLADNLPTAGLKLEHFTTYDPKDPLQPYNRVMQNFNDQADRYALKPVAQAYRAVVPQPLQLVVSNVFSNLGDVWSSVNNLLQWKPGAALNDAGRFLVNSSLGLFGMADVASAIGMEKHDEDFGQTLGHWGVPSGPYVVLPLFGPSTVRDALSRPVDGYGSYYAWTDGATLRNSMYMIEKVSDRASLLEAEKAFNDAALDRYTLLRDGWLARRRNQVYDGDPPEEDDPYGDDPYGDDPYADDPTAEEPSAGEAPSAVN